MAESQVAATVCSRQKPTYYNPSGFTGIRMKGKAQQGIFRGLSFCFPVVDMQLTHSAIELLSLSIQAEEGRVVAFQGRAVQGEVDYLLIHPLLLPEAVHSKVAGKVAYKEMLDYRFVEESLQQGKLLSQEPYSLYFNLHQFEHPPPNPRKQVKADSNHNRQQREDVGK